MVFVEERIIEAGSSELLPKWGDELSQAELNASVRSVCKHKYMHNCMQVQSYKFEISQNIKVEVNKSSERNDNRIRPSKSPSAILTG